MPAIMKIKSAYASLPTAERRVAEFILNNPAKAPLMVINEIANEVGVSVPSVTRLAKKLGYEGFLDFRVALAQGSAAMEIETTEPISEKDSDEAIIEKTFKCCAEAIEDTLKALDKKALTNLADSIITARRIIVFGTAASATFAYDLAKQLVFLGFDAVSVNDTMTMELYSKKLQRDDLFIGVTRSGRTKIITETVKTAKQRGAMTVLISNYVNAASSNYSDFFFCTSRLDDIKRIVGRETNITMSAWLTALTALLAVRKAK